jgi:predicted TIM-barrel fold metal-dependent hydrolase
MTDPGGTVLLAGHPVWQTKERERMGKVLIGAVSAAVALATAVAWSSDGVQPAGATRKYTGPIFDVHIHTTAPQGWAGRPNPVTGVPAPRTASDHRAAVLDALRRFNVVRAVLHGPSDSLQAWTDAAPQLFLPMPMLFEPPADPIPTTDFLRRGITAKQFAGIGEVIAQYAGVSLADAALQPYWALAQDLDVPVAVHTGRSFAGIMYQGYPKFRLRLGNPLDFEEALATHPRLRAYIMHAGEPWRQETLAMMSMYPQLYMDIGAVVWLMPRPALHALLRDLMAHGLGNRIMFGTDEMAWPDAIGLAVANVDAADFLTGEQKADIFYRNAARFFRSAGIAP